MRISDWSSDVCSSDLCALCRWGDHCESVWQAEDSLFNVANITRPQVKKLEAAGIRTMEALAGHDHPVRGLAETTRARLVTQARLQQARKTGAPRFELREPEPGKLGRAPCGERVGLYV